MVRSSCTTSSPLQNCVTTSTYLHFSLSISFISKLQTLHTITLENIAKNGHFHNKINVQQIPHFPHSSTLHRLRLWAPNRLLSGKKSLNPLKKIQSLIQITKWASPISWILFLFFAGFGRSSKAQEGIIHRRPFQASEAHFQRRIVQEDQEEQEAVVAQRPPPLLQVSQTGAPRRRWSRRQKPDWVDIGADLRDGEQERGLDALLQVGAAGEGWGWNPVFESPGGECGGDAHLFGHVMGWADDRFWRFLFEWNVF